MSVEVDCEMPSVSNLAIIMNVTGSASTLFNRGPITFQVPFGYLFNVTASKQLNMTCKVNGSWSNVDSTIKCMSSNINLIKYRKLNYLPRRG